MKKLSENMTTKTKRHLPKVLARKKQPRTAYQRTERQLAVYLLRIVLRKLFFETKQNKLFGKAVFCFSTNKTF
jgi:hypothetical protein